MVNEKYLSEQVITYLGNKRKLLNDISYEVELILNELGLKKGKICDLFSGSGVVARMLKQYSSRLFVNDLEEYSCIINSCYLTNQEDFNNEFYNECLSKLELINRTGALEYIEGRKTSFNNQHSYNYYKNIYY